MKVDKKNIGLNALLVPLFLFLKLWYLL